MQNRGSTPFLTLGIPECTMLPILAVQGWGRAGVTAVIKEGQDRTEWSSRGQQTNCVKDRESSVTIHTDISKSWFSFYTKDGFIFWYFSHVFNILMVSSSSKRISGSWWHGNFSVRYLPAHWIQSHGQIYTQTDTHTVPEIPLRDGLHEQNLYPQKIS